MLSMGVYEKAGAIYADIDKNRKTSAGLPYVGDVSIPKRPYELIFISNFYGVFHSSIKYNEIIKYSGKNNSLYQ